MARPNRKKAVETAEAAIEPTTPAIEVVPETPAPAPKTVTVYAVNTSSDEDEAEKKPVKDSSVGGVMLGIIDEITSHGQLATKAAILEEFRVSEKAGSLRAAQWLVKPQEYVNGYVDWLKGNRSVVSTKAEV